MQHTHNRLLQFYCILLILTCMDSIILTALARPVRHAHRKKVVRFSCNRGDLFSIDCNICFCEANHRNRVICEVKDCRWKQACNPNSSFLWRGRKCVCQPDGKRFCAIDKATLP